MFSARLFTPSPGSGFAGAGELLPDRRDVTITPTGVAFNRSRLPGSDGTRSFKLPAPRLVVVASGAGAYAEALNWS